jgi:integrase
LLPRPPVGLDEAEHPAAIASRAPVRSSALLKEADVQRARLHDTRHTGGGAAARTKRFPAAQQFIERADAWPEWRENGLVFPTRIGTPMEPDNLRRSWGRIRTTAELTGTRFHDMRHTCVSLLLHLV